MFQKLVDIHSLLDILGFTDLRSVKRFCVSNKIPLFNLGKKTYTMSSFIDHLIETELTAFVNSNYDNPSEVLKAVKEGNNVTPIVSFTSAKTEANKKSKKPISKASQEFLKKIK